MPLSSSHKFLNETSAQVWQTSFRLYDIGFCDRSIYSPTFQLVYVVLRYSINGMQSVENDIQPNICWRRQPEILSIMAMYGKMVIGLVWRRWESFTLY